ADERAGVLRRDGAGGSAGLHPDPRHRARAPLRGGLVAHRARPRLRAHLHPPDRRPGARHRRGGRSGPVVRGGAAGPARAGGGGVQLGRGGPLAGHHHRRAGGRPGPGNGRQPHHRRRRRPMTDHPTTPSTSTFIDAEVPSRRALVVRGGWEGHQPVEATDMFIPYLEENGFEVRIEGSPAVYADAEYMATVDLIVQCVTMSSIEREQFEGLRAAIEAGTGMAGWHGGIADSY